MNGCTGLFGISAGALAIFVGAYSLLQTNAVANWLRAHGIRHAIEAAEFIRQIKTVGVLFILAGGFFIAVALRNR